MPRPQYCQETHVLGGRAARCNRIEPEKDRFLAFWLEFGFGFDCRACLSASPGASMAISMLVRCFASRNTNRYGHLTSIFTSTRTLTIETRSKSGLSRPFWQGAGPLCVAAGSLTRPEGDFRGRAHVFHHSEPFGPSESIGHEQATTSCVHFRSVSDTVCATEGRSDCRQQQQQKRAFGPK